MILRRILELFAIPLLILAATHCSMLNPEENEEEGPYLPEYDPIARPAYWDPVWHPSGAFIGFNHVPLTGIHFPWGDKAPGEYEFDWVSRGFWLINADGTNMRRILPSTLQCPAWSPDGEWISFVIDAQIFKMRFIGAEFDTTSLTQLTFEGLNYFPSWSSDGEWIVYDSNFESPSGRQFIWKMRADGNQKDRIGYSASGSTREPNWSLVGQKITFVHFCGGGTYYPEIFTMDIAGTNWERLTSNDVDDESPAYSPDGHRIAYVSRIIPEYPQLWIMNMDRTGQLRLTSEGIDSAYGRPFTWNPASGEIVYTVYRWDEWTAENGVLWIINTQSGKKRQLTFNIIPGR